MKDEILKKVLDKRANSSLDWLGEWPSIFTAGSFVTKREQRIRSKRAKARARRQRRKKAQR